MEKIYIVHLRQPRNNPDEMRSDPFWEFGSFGRTGCHCKNLLNKNNCSKLTGNRLAFAQNGKEGFKLVLLTPPVNIYNYKLLNEAMWDNKHKPFKYSNAPLIVNNECQSDFPVIKKCQSDFPLLCNHIQRVKRDTCVSKFSSAFRSRCSPLEDEIAKEVLEVYNSKYKNSIKSNFISKYTDALPYPPVKVDRNRNNTYNKLLSESIENIIKTKSKCGKC